MREAVSVDGYSVLRPANFTTLPHFSVIGDPLAELGQRAGNDPAAKLGTARPQLAA